MAAAKNSIAARREAAPAMALTTGTPSTIPAETPIITFATAFGARAGSTEAAAREKAMDT